MQRGFGTPSAGVPMLTGERSVHHHIPVGMNGFILPAPPEYAAAETDRHDVISPTDLLLQRHGRDRQSDLSIP